MNILANKTSLGRCDRLKWPGLEVEDSGHRQRSLALRSAHDLHHVCTSVFLKHIYLNMNDKARQCHGGRFGRTIGRTGCAQSSGKTCTTRVVAPRARKVSRQSRLEGLTVHPTDPHTVYPIPRSKKDHSILLQRDRLQVIMACASQ